MHGVLSIPQVGSGAEAFWSLEFGVPGLLMHEDAGGVQTNMCIYTHIHTPIYIYHIYIYIHICYVYNGFLLSPFAAEMIAARREHPFPPALDCDFCAEAGGQGAQVQG